MFVFVPANPKIPDQSLRALSVYTLLASLPMTFRNFHKEFGINEWIVFIGVLALIYSPCIIYEIAENRRKILKSPPFSPATFEWSWYASLMGVLMTQVCLMIGISYGMLLPLMLANTICLILPMLAVNLRQEKSPAIYHIPESLTRMDIAILTVYTLTAGLFIYFYPLGTISFGDDCLNKWVCSYHGVFAHKNWLMAATLWSVSTAHGCLKIWRAPCIHLVISTEEPGILAVTGFVRRGWKWIPINEKQAQQLREILSEFLVEESDVEEQECVANEGEKLKIN